MLQQRIPPADQRQQNQVKILLYSNGCWYPIIDIFCMSTTVSSVTHCFSLIFTTHQLSELSDP